jgi:hypothetical protein
LCHLRHILGSEKPDFITLQTILLWPSNSSGDSFPDKVNQVDLDSQLVETVDENTR